MNAEASSLLNKLEETHALEQREWEALIAAQSPHTLRDAAARAARLRDARYGKRVFIRGLIEINSYCKNDCLYCGIRRANARAVRYRLSPEEILSCCETGHALGFRTFVLQGGEDPWFSDARLAPLIEEIRARYPDCAITLSLGERSQSSYQRLFEAGADRYLLRHESADAAHYARIHPAAMSPEARKACLRSLRAIGYQVGSGFMVGAPGQTPAHLAADMAFLHDLQPHMVGIGPFIPHRDTPFANEAAGSLETTLYLLALVRLMLPDVLLPATTALGTIAPDGRERGIEAGANVVMPNLSPLAHRADYSLYDGKVSTGEEAAEGLALLKARMERIGYEVVEARGDSLVATER